MKIVNAQKELYICIYCVSLQKNQMLLTNFKMQNIYQNVWEMFVLGRSEMILRNKLKINPYLFLLSA